MKRTRGDPGTVLIFVALSLTVLMIFAAFALDFGAAKSARRKAQGTVDAGTLAGGQLLVAATGTLTGATADAIAEEVITLTHLNLTGDPAMSDAGEETPIEWRNRFTTCVDPDRLTRGFPVRSAVSDCISFNSITSISRVRVRLPDLHVPTSFANVIGIDSLDVNAAAEVQLVPSNSGGLLPFGMLAGASGLEVCLKTGSQPTLPPCDGPDSGNFGTLNLRFFGNPVLGTPQTCSGDETLRLSVNIALGVDHRLAEFVSGSPLHDDEACPDLDLWPDQIDGRPGMTAQTLDNGLIEGTILSGHPIPGRLSNGPWEERLIRTGGTPELDNRPLWTFIDPALTESTAPAECVPSITPISNKAGMADCLLAYTRAPTGEYEAGRLFAADTDGEPGLDILRSPRLAWVPKFHEAEWGSGRKDYTIATFQPLFLQTLYLGCSGSGCLGIFDPGETGSSRFPLGSSDSTKAEALTALVLTNSMLPQAVLDRGPAGVAAYELVLRW